MNGPLKINDNFFILESPSRIGQKVLSPPLYFLLSLIPISFLSRFELSNKSYHQKKYLKILLHKERGLFVLITAPNEVNLEVTRTLLDKFPGFRDLSERQHTDTRR